MATKINNPFQRRLAIRRQIQNSGTSPDKAESKISPLETVFQFAQIALAIVAIFGYFYTVRPIYQKERLSEQVAEFEGIIKQQKPKIAEIENRLSELQHERDQLTSEIQRERARLTTELQNIQKQLSAAREEKSKIESQIQFMTFRYRLPDGSPAVTREQVKIAQDFELKRSFMSSLFMSCSLALGDSNFPTYSYSKDDGKNKSWPFSEQELTIWKEYGTKYPLKRATECIDSVAASFTQRYGQNDSSGMIEINRKEAIQFSNRASAKTWSPPTQPADIIQELANKRLAIQSELTADLKKVEEEYGNWESTFGEARREIFRHNYTVGKQNANSKAFSNRLSADYNAQQKANDFRKSIHEEVRRLIVTEK